jgi:hypothetical protein
MIERAVLIDEDDDVLDLVERPAGTARCERTIERPCLQEMSRSK